MFELSEEQRLGVEELRRFIRREIEPVVHAHRDTAFPSEVAHDLFARLSPYGLGSGWVSEEAGGYGIDLITSALLYEELSRVSTGLSAQICVNDSVGFLLERFASPELRDKFVPALVSGEKIASIAVTEPGSGSQPGLARTKAVRDGNSWVISGEKVWISNADVSDLALVVCRIDGKMGLLLVEREHGYTSANFHKLGQKEKSTGQLVFEDVRVPVGNMVGEPGDALRLMAKSFERARIMVAFYSTGVAAAALDASIEYAKTRVQWGKPIGGHQLIQAMLADMATDLECSRLLALKGMSLVARGQQCAREAAMAKWYAAEASLRITSNAIQIHGSYGLSEEFPVEKYFRDARMNTIPDGTTQILKLLIGRDLTGISAFE